jgi:monofunctional biosynthetic peptidoglycan transglycosylase
MAVQVTIDVPLHPAAWQVVNDGVMGGVSTAAVRADGAALRFEGEVSLQYGGGFASARCAFELPPADAVRVRGVTLRVLGDGRRYRITLFTRNRATGQREAYQYQAPWATHCEEQAFTLPLVAFVASFRGRPVAAPEVDPRLIVAVGLQISDRQAGPFAVLVRQIRFVPV